MPGPIANRETVIYALYLLGGATKKLHTEDVALKCYELAPDSFSWTKHPQYPDKEVARVALMDARKDRYGGFVDGRAGQNRGQFQKTQRQPTTDGWTLTDAGVSWIEQNLDRFSNVLGGKIAKEHRQKSLQLLGRVKRHKVFRQFSEGNASFRPKIGDLAELLRCRVDADHAVWEDRFERIRKHALAAGQDEIARFVEKSIVAYETQR